MFCVQTINCLDHILKYYSGSGFKKQKLQNIWTVMSMTAAMQLYIYAERLISKPKSTSLSI